MHQEGQKLMIQMTLHDNRKTENIQHVHINNPKAEAIVIGNDNQIKTQEVDQIRSKTIEYIERIEGEVVYIRKQNDEILEQMKRMVRIITYLSLTRN